MKHLVDQHVLIDNNRIAHGIHGNGEPVILIHGTPSSSFIWRQVAPTLVKKGFKVHVFDLLGYGLSERPWDPEIDTSVSGQLPIFERLLDIWELDELHIVSHDIGGGIAKQFSICAPERVRSLTMIDVVSFDSWPSKRTREQMQKGLANLIQATDADHRAHFSNWLDSTVKNKEKLNQVALETYLDFISGPVGQASFFQHQVRHYDPIHTASFADRYEALGELPVQIIWGADDSWQVVEWAHKLHNAIPNSQLHIIEDCGHFAMEDKPEDITEKLISFLKAHSK